MKTAEALKIFSDIGGDAPFSDKLDAIETVLRMPTHMSVEKDTMLEVIEWLTGAVDYIVDNKGMEYAENIMEG